MIIIGMTGPIGHGKSTFAKALVEIEPLTKRLETSMLVAEVANGLHASTNELPNRDDIASINEWLHPLPAILSEIVKVQVNFSNIQIDAEEVLQHPIEYEKLFLHIENLHHKPEMLNQAITYDNKEEYRPILQFLGGYLINKVGPKIWYHELVRRAYMVADEGFKLCIIGGLRYPSDADIVHQAGGKVIKVYRPGHLQYDMLDPTERERENIQPDATIISDKGLEEVKICAIKVYEDLKNNKLQTNYIASHVAPAP